VVQPTWTPSISLKESSPKNIIHSPYSFKAMRQIILIILAALLIQGKTLATDRIRPTWAELAITSEFVGVVECIVAGGIVARYRVIDSWKGASVGTELNISQHVDPFGPQFPVSLVGERSLVFEEKNTSYRLGSFRAGVTTPLWWRKVPADLSCFSMVPVEERMESYLISYTGYRSGGLAQLKADVANLLKGDSLSQERSLMLAAAGKGLHLPNSVYLNSKGNEEDIKLYELLCDAKDVDALWRRILEQAAKLNPPRIPETSVEIKAASHKRTLLRMISDGGRERCKALLELADPSMLPWDKQELVSALSDIRRNLSPRKGESMPLEDKPVGKRPVTGEDISKAESSLGEEWDAFELLCHHSPGSVVSYLIGWQPSKDLQNEQFGYVLGSVFGHLCKPDRIQHLKALLSAKDDWIKVSAAVYLCFDDAKQGKEALSKLLTLEGDAGAWAAIVLASRGEKTAMPRALEVMSIPGDLGMHSMNHHNLQLRLRVLLSNVANASGVAQPPGPSKEYYDWPENRLIHQQWFESLSKWWEVNKDRIKLSDPWSGVLDAQKVD
jgi:hypothetical protein